MRRSFYPFCRVRSREATSPTARRHTSTPPPRRSRLIIPVSIDTQMRQLLISYKTVRPPASFGECTETINQISEKTQNSI